MRDLLKLYLLDNPIAAAEVNHLRHSRGYRRRWRRWVNWWMLRIAMALAVVLYGSFFVIALTGPPIVQQSPFDLSSERALMLLLLVAAIITLIWHLVLTLQTLGLASHSITREKSGNTWELLLLTNITPARLTWGKWWGIARRQFRPYLRLTLFSLGIICGIQFGGYVATYLDYVPAQSGETLIPVFPNPLAVLFGGLILALLMFFSLGLTAACGILAGALSRRWAGAVAWSLFLRGLATVAPIGLVLLLPRFVPDFIYRSLNTVSLYSDSTIGIFALGDNGLSLTLFGPLEIGYEWTESTYVEPPSFRNSLPRLLFAVANPVVISVLLILAFQWMAVRYMAWANRRG